MGKQYSGYGYHGGGRPRKPEGEKAVYKSVTISGRPDEIEKLKERARRENKTLSRFLIDNSLNKD